MYITRVFSLFPFLDPDLLTKEGTRKDSLSFYRLRKRRISNALFHVLCYGRPAKTIDVAYGRKCSAKSRTWLLSNEEKTKFCLSHQLFSVS